MFDTSVVKAHAISGPRKVTLVVSLAIHSLVVLAALALTVTSTDMPSQPPRQLELYRPVVLPAPPPAPLGRPAQPHQAQPRSLPPQQAVAPPQITAPQTIPDQTPIVVGDATPATGPIGNGPVSDEPIGDPNGVPGGVGVGPASGPGVPGPYTPGAGVTSARVLSRVEPRFPQAFVHGVRSAIVVVRCVIGSNGEIRDPEIVTSSFPPFNDAVLTALRQWKFAPGMMHGQAVDTWFELTVRFQVK